MARSDAAPDSNYKPGITLIDEVTDDPFALEGISEIGAAKIALVDGSGDQIVSFGGGTQHNEDDAHSSGDKGTMALGVRRDAATSPVSTDGDYHSLIFDNAGNLKTIVKNGSGNNSIAIQGAAGAASANAGSPLKMGGVFYDSPATINNAEVMDLRVSNRGVLIVGTDSIGGNLDVDIAAGTNAIGKLLPPDVDVTSHTNYTKKYYTSAGAATDGIIWSPAAGKRWHVVSLFINISAAATITLEDDLAAGDSVVMKMELAANSGIMIPFGEKYPLASGEDAADLLVTSTAGNIYITTVGYEV
jgi:hypothetical protein